MRSLFARLLLGFTLLLLILGATVLWVTHKSQKHYHLELNQQLHSPVAMYIAQNAELVTDNGINPERITALANHLMMLNPGVEVYAVDVSGKIIAAANADAKLTRTSIDMRPIHQYLSDQREFPLLAENPLDATSKTIFSAFPVYPPNTVDKRNKDDKLAVGYVYVVLASQVDLSFREAIYAHASSHSLAKTLSAIVILAAIAAGVLFFLLTSRLRRLRRDVVEQMAVAALPAPLTPQTPSGGHDELDELAYAYQHMTRALEYKNRQLQHADSSRRELFASVSHDLRTPLTTLQSYLETLMTHGNQFDVKERDRYLHTALNHTRRLNSLVTDLFELTRLDNGDMQPRWETFSVLELAHDIVQDYKPGCDQKDVKLHISHNAAESNRLLVRADIAMTTRVFTNLLSNALRFTKADDQISISLQQQIADRVTIVFSDTGIGMSESKQKLITSQQTLTQWKRDYRARGGLGLQIVRRILTLHGSEILLESQSGKGTRFTFHLPAPA